MTVDLGRLLREEDHAPDAEYTAIEALTLMQSNEVEAFVHPAYPEHLWTWGGIGLLLITPNPHPKTGTHISRFSIDAFCQLDGYLNWEIPSC